jgi:hypothetical protein
MNENRTVKIDDPMTFGYGIDATDSSCKNQWCGTNIFSSQRTGRHDDDRPLVTPWLEKISTEEDFFDLAVRSSGDAYVFACSAIKL